MTKADRQEFDARMRALPHYQRLALEHCLNYGLTTKRAELDKMKAKESAK